MNKIQSTVMNRLLDKYESSKTFQGENKNQQSFTIHIADCFPKYKDDAEYEYFLEVNEALAELEEKKLITLKRQKNGILQQAVLNLQELDSAYRYMSRKPRKTENEWLMKTLEEFEQLYGTLSPIQGYISAQKYNLERNKKVQLFDGDETKYTDSLKMVAAALQNEDEVFIRDFSIRLFQDSKRAEQLESRVESVLYQYGDFEERETVLEECGIVKTPTYVMLKGNVRLSLHGQVLDLSKLEGDISLSTVSLRELDYVEVLGARIVTIENLTSFHDYKNRDDCVIYLGGFHNKTKRRFLCFLFEQNREKEDRHFGDIDVGGFYILEHLKRKTGIAFQSLYMDEETLRSHLNEAKKLTKEDKTRLNKLRDEVIRKRKAGELTEDYMPVLDLMLEKNCKLEQEAIQSR